MPKELPHLLPLDHPRPARPSSMAAPTCRLLFASDGLVIETAANAWLATDLDDFFALAEEPEIGLANRAAFDRATHTLGTRR